MAAEGGDVEERELIRREFEQLQKEYKTMETMKKAYADESLTIIRKQKEMIEKLQRENESLKAELDLEMRYAQKKEAKDSGLLSLHDQLDLYVRKTAVEEKNIEVLQSNIRTVKKRIDELRRDVGGANAGKENLAMMQKQIRILENRLDKALVKFNEALASNKELRKQIDDLRQERVVFDGIYRKLEKDLHDRKKDMANIIEESNQAYEIRDNATIQLMDLQAALAREREEFERDIADLNARIDAEEKAAQEHERVHRGDLTMDEEKSLRDSKRRLERDLAKEKSKLQAASERVAYYEEAFTKIRDATSISDINELVTSFVKNEETNFSLFNFVAEQASEIERLEDSIAAMRAEAEAASAASGTTADSHRSLLQELEMRLSTTRSAAEKFEAQYSAAQATVEALREGIQRVFSRLDCDRRGMAEMLEGASVTEANAMQFLGVVEQRANEILQAFAAAKTIELGVVSTSDGGGSPTGGKSAGGSAASPALPAGSRAGAGAARGGAGAASSAAASAASPSSASSGTGAGGEEVTLVMAAHPDARRQAASTIASVLGSGPASRPKAPGESGLKVDVPRLRDFAGDEDDSEDEEETRPLTMSELKASLAASGIGRDR